MRVGVGWTRPTSGRITDGRPASNQSLEAADPPAGLTRGVIEVGGLPFFPRAVEHNGEPLVAIKGLGFNCVHLTVPATAELLAEARRADVWVICPPPPIPDVDVRDPDALPSLRNWDRVLMWDLGTGLAAGDLEHVAERGRRVRACDPRAGRPLIATADAALRDLSRHVDLLVARRTVLGTSLEFVDYVQWLRQRPLLARPGTPFLASLATEIDQRAAGQAAAIAGVGARGVAIDPESLLLAAQATVAAGARGILFTSSARLDADDRSATRRAAAVRSMNLRMGLLEPWGAAGRFAANATTSDPEVQAVVIEASRARVVLAWRGVQGAQISARRYGGGDLPREDAPLTLLVPGVPEAHQAWELAPGGLRPLRQRRVNAEFPDAYALLTQAAAGDRDRIGLPVDLDRGNRIDRGEDALVANPAECQMLWRIAQGHEGDEFAFVEIKRQRVFAGDCGGNRFTVFIDRIDRGGHRARLAGEFDRLHDAADGGGQPPI